MKILNKYQLKKRITDNYAKEFWSAMTSEEKDWCVQFENFEFQIEQGKVETALSHATMLNPSITSRALANIKDVCNTSERGFAASARKTRYENKQKQNLRKPKSNLYDYSDWVEYETQYSINEETGEGQESEVSVVIDPQEYLAEAIHESQIKKCSLERLVEDYKLSKIAKADLLARTQKMTYEAMTYTFHGNEYMNLNYVLKGVNGQLYVQDQHDRIQSLALYLTRHTNDSYATHAEVWYPNQPGQIWIYKPGAKSNIEGKAVQYENR